MSTCTNWNIPILVLLSKSKTNKFTNERYSDMIKCRNNLDQDDVLQLQNDMQDINLGLNQEEQQFLLE